MNKLLFIVVLIAGFNATAQDKKTETYFNSFTEVKGTPYVIAGSTTRSKMDDNSTQALRFINTQNGTFHQIDFPEAAAVVTEQIKIDELNINSIVVVAKTIDLNGKKGIDWNDPRQLFLISVDGTEKRQLTGDHFFVNQWIVNSTTGAIVINGVVDHNKNGKIDKEDNHRTMIYDIKTLTLLSEL